MDTKIKNRNTDPKKSGRFNAVDLLLILLILVVFTVLLLLFDPFSWMGNDNTEEVTIRYTVEIKNVSNELKNNIKQGDRAISSSTDYDMGSVVSVEVTDSYTWEYNEGDFMEKKPVGGKSDLLVVISVKAIYEPDVGYMVDGKHIAVGSQFGFCFPNYVGSGYCIDVERADK